LKEEFERRIWKKNLKEEFDKKKTFILYRILKKY